MDVIGRSTPPPTADERGILTGWLDWQRGTVPAKCAGLADADARRTLIPSSPQLTVAGVVAHLITVERHWLVGSFLGDRSASQPSDESGWNDTRTSLPTLLETYAGQCEVSRRIVAGHSLDAVEQYAPQGLPRVSLRWILGHLIEETARHLGHLDLLRELTDGERGY